MTNFNSINTFKKMASEYIVTVKKEVDLEEFYNDMETPGGSSTIPDREVVCYDRRQISRNTGYLLADEEVDALKNDSRVIDVISNELLNRVVIRSSWSQSSNNWDKGFTIQNTHNNWGLYRSINGSQVSNWGSNGTSSISGIVTTTSSGNNVDVVIVDGHLNPLHPEFAVNEDGSGGSRVVQYNWYQHNTELGLGANGTYVYPTGSNLFNPEDNHGMHVAGTACGNTQGWARDSNIYNISPYSNNPNTLITNSFNIFDYIRTWHNQKSINPTTGLKNPTILNNSWGAYWVVPKSSISSINYKGVLYSGPFTDSQLVNYGIVDFNATNVYVAAYIPAYNVEIEDSVDAGIIFVGSAGNDSTKIDVQGGSDYNNYIFAGESYYYHRGDSISSASRVGTGSQRLSISVGAISSLIDESKATFSNCGPRVDIYAPGVNIISSLHDGVGTVPDSRNSSYVLGKYQGTSMASPQVCGVLACLLETYPNLNQANVLQHLKQSSSKNLIPNANGGYTDFTSLQDGNNLYLKYSSVFLNPSISDTNKPFGARNINLIGGDYIPNITSDNDLNINADNVGISSNLNVANDITSEKYYGDGATLVGIVTNLIPGIAVDLFPTQTPGNKGQVVIQSYRPVGKTIYVAQNGSDTNTGLTENHPKRTIKSAAASALYGDTIKVYPGVYEEENPIVLNKTVSVQGTELRNCVITPKFPNKDIFYVNNGCHLTNLSFIGPEMTNGAAVIALQKLQGVSDDRFFDGARMIRLNLDYIAKESVGFLTSGFSGFAGNHREQDAARLIDKNLNFIASEAVGFLTASVGSGGYGFNLTGSNYTNCKEDVVSIMGAVSYDLKANSNRKSIGAGYSYFGSPGGLIHITGIGVSQATIAALNYAAGISTYVINNQAIPRSYQVGIAQSFDASVIQVAGGCVGVGITVKQLVGIVTNMIGAGSTLVAPTVRYGVTLESDLCALDVKRIWKGICFDMTRGGNFKSVKSGKSYRDENGNLLPGILKNPQEVEQTISTLDYSFNIARSVINNCTWGGYPVGLGTTVSNAIYGKETGITTVTAQNHGLSLNDAVKIKDLKFTCSGTSGITTNIFPDGTFGYIFPVKKVIDANTFEFVGGISTITHNYVSGGKIQKYDNFQRQFTQVKDLGMQVDYATGFNNTINSCSNVISAIRSYVGIVTTLVNLGPATGINTSYPGNSGLGFETVFNISDAIYEPSSGKTTIEAPGIKVREGDLIEIRDLLFECASEGPSSTQLFPSGRFGYEFYVDTVNSDGTFVVNVGISTLPHTYVSGGIVVNRAIQVSQALYDNVTGLTTITAPGAKVKLGDLITLRDLEFSCNSGAGTTTIYPTSNRPFEVMAVSNLGQTFEVRVGSSSIPHTYVSGSGVVFPSYSRGVGPITQGPYVRNCTNFIPKSIGMKVDGFDAEPGDEDDIGVTGTMSVDSYTQYNQGGIGVSITNGGYAQLVSIFTICDDIAIFTSSGGQCDLTNSNASFGNYGLYSVGVGDQTSKSIYRYTGTVKTDAGAETDKLVITGVGNNRPYDGQAIYFGELFYIVNRIIMTNGGSGYNFRNPPRVDISFPSGENGIRAEASPNIDEDTGSITSIDVISSGSQYRLSDNIQITIDPPSFPGGTQASATCTLQPIYYNIESATLPVEGQSTIVLTQFLNSKVGAGTTVYFSRLSLQIATTISFEWVGAGTNINTAKPALGGLAIKDNEVRKVDGGQVVFTSTNQAGNFRIGEGLTVNQLTGTITGRSFSQSLLNTVTPLIIALGK
jgi:hypothetical protein